MLRLTTTTGMPSARSSNRLLIAACAAACCWSWTALAATPVLWHADIDAARAASRTSQRPVLAVFSATWSEAATRVEAQTLTDAGVAALLSGCFEPVLVDVDQHPDLTRRLNITHVPAAAIVGDDDAVLTTFECPESPAAFVAACGRAAQEAARRETGRFPASRTAERQPETDSILRAAIASRTAAVSRFNELQSAPDGTEASPASATVVSAKVRHLSDFASIETRQTSTTMLVTGTQAPRATAQTVDLPDSVAGPVAPRPAWPAQQSAAPLAAISQSQAQSSAPTYDWPAVRPQGQQQPTSIEPRSTTPPATPQPWLGQASTPQPQQAPQAAGAAVASTAPPVGIAPRPTPSPTQPPAVDTKPTKPDMLAAFKNPFGMFSKPAPAVTPPPTLPPARTTQDPTLATTTPAATVAAQPAADAYGTMPLGLEGYCPVTLSQKGVWTEGRPQYGARHRGRTYLFAGAEQQQAFLADPDRYAPALSGDDPVLALESGKTAPGQRRYGVTYQSRMYLFSTPETRSAFAANPERYTTRVALAEQPVPAAAGTRRF